jgi:hypothetical protein
MQRLNPTSDEKIGSITQKWCNEIASGGCSRAVGREVQRCQRSNKWSDKIARTRMLRIGA